MSVLPPAMWATMPTWLPAGQVDSGTVTRCVCQ